MKLAGSTVTSLDLAEAAHWGSSLPSAALGECAMVMLLEKLPPCVHLQHRDHRWLGGSGVATQRDPDAVFPSPELPHQPQPTGDPG